MEELKLNEAVISDSLDIRQMLQEIGPGENGFQNTAFNLSETEFNDWLRLQVDHSKGINLELNYVPMTTYWLKGNGYPVGLSKLRHYLNEDLLKIGGHIGFCIRPTERGKNYACEILIRTLEKAELMGINKVLLTSGLENVAPERRF
jgi:predicted acetyltransferase